VGDPMWKIDKAKGLGGVAQVVHACLASALNSNPSNHLKKLNSP
jgi:hypothetical protein